MHAAALEFTDHLVARSLAWRRALKPGGSAEQCRKVRIVGACRFRRPAMRMVALGVEVAARRGDLGGQNHPEGDRHEHRHRNACHTPHETEMKLVPATGQESMVHIRCRRPWIFLAFELVSMRARSVQFFRLGQAADFHQGFNSGSSNSSEASGLLRHLSQPNREAFRIDRSNRSPRFGKTLV